MQTQEFLLKAREPEEVLSETENNPMFTYAASMLKKCLDLVAEAKKTEKGNTIFFPYSGDTSMSSEISNMLIYEFPKHYICVAFRKEGSVNISLRGKKVDKMLEKILANLGAGTGGGHPDAVGARIPRNKLEDFERMFREMAGKIKL
jgi:single-stranded DNA-specific DHH superfamily exonuclease